MQPEGLGQYEIVATDSESLNFLTRVALGSFSILLRRTVKAP